MFLLIAIGGVVGYRCFKIRSKTGGPVASDHHIVLQKNDKLKETTETVAEDTARLFEEFRQLEEEVKNGVQESTDNSKKEINKKHNRYIDMGRLNIRSIGYYNCIF